MSKADLYRNDITAWAEDHFIVDRRYVNGRWQHRPAPIVLADYQKDILKHIFQIGRYHVVIWSEPAKSGKTTILALIVTWAGLHQDSAECYVIANDLKQAQSRAFALAKYACQKNRALNPKITKDEIRLKNGFIRALASDYRGESGSDPSVTTFDESEMFIYESQSRLVSEFKISPTRNVSIQLFAGYGGWQGESNLWEDLLNRRETGTPVLPHIVNSDGSPACWDCGSTFVFYSNVLRQEWQTPEWVEAQRENLTPGDFSRLIENKFIPVSSSVFVQPEWWQACYDPRIKPIQPGDPTPVVLALDLAAGTSGGDHIALVGVSRNGHHLAVRYINEWTPPADGRFDYTPVIEEIKRLARDNNIIHLAYDPYQMVHLANELEGLFWKREFNQMTERDEADRRLHDLIVNRQLHHYGDRRLDEHIAAAGANQKGDNRLRIVKAGRRKVDLAVALSMACHRAMAINFEDKGLEVKKTVSELIRDRTEQDEAWKRLRQSQGRKNGTPEAPPATNGTDSVKIIYQGNMVSFTLNTLQGPQVVARNHTYEVTKEVFENLQTNYPYHWFLRIG